jgi:hypothetical protein
VEVLVDLSLAVNGGQVENSLVSLQSFQSTKSSSKFLNIKNLPTRAFPLIQFPIVH